MQSGSDPCHVRWGFASWTGSVLRGKRPVWLFGSPPLVPNSSVFFIHWPVITGPAVASYIVVPWSGNSSKGYSVSVLNLQSFHESHFTTSSTQRKVNPCLLSHPWQIRGRPRNVIPQLPLWDLSKDVWVLQWDTEIKAQTKEKAREGS